MFKFVKIWIKLFKLIFLIQGNIQTKISKIKMNPEFKVQTNLITIHVHGLTEL